MNKHKYNIGDIVIFDNKKHIHMMPEEKEILSKPCHIKEIKFDVGHQCYLYKLTEIQYIQRNIWYAEHCFLNVNEPNNLLNWIYTERSK